MESVKVKIFQRKRYEMVIEKHVEKTTFIDLVLGNLLITEEEFKECYEQVTEIEFRHKEISQIKNEKYPYRLLKEVFCHFNTFKEEQDKLKINYSMSVLDVIEIDNEKYQVMGSGFKKLNF